MLQKAHSEMDCGARETGQVNYYNDNDPQVAAEFIKAYEECDKR
jgi:hypothetical protein